MQIPSRSAPRRPDLGEATCSKHDGRFGNVDGIPASLEPVWRAERGAQSEVIGSWLSPGVPGRYRPVRSLPACEARQADRCSRVVRPTSFLDTRAVIATGTCGIPSP